MARYKKKRKKHVSKNIFYIIIIIAIIMIMSTAYSLLSSNLYIVGNVLAQYKEPELDVKVPAPTIDSNGVTRYTANTEFEYWGVEIFRVIDETYADNTISTTLKYIYKQLLSSSHVNGTITMTLQNSTNSTFKNGRIEIIEIYDPDEAFKTNTPNIGSATVEAGATVNPSVTLKLAGKSIAKGTMCKYRITYEVDGIEKCFYYILNLEPN